MMAGKETAVVWFNGPSASDLHHIARQPLEIGCNFIEQHRAVDHVCAYDQDVISRLPATTGVSYWTRRNMVTQRFRLVPSEVKYSCSGTMAVRLARHLGARRIYVIGCDWEHTNASIYDSEYSWREHQPRKYTLARRGTMVETARDTELVLITDRGVPYEGVKTVAVRDFLGMIKC